jgi:hypothetical protein
MKKRRRFRQIESRAERLGVFARLMGERAQLMPVGREQSETLAKAEQAEAKRDRWLSEPELEPPK